MAGIWRMNHRVRGLRSFHTIIPRDIFMLIMILLSLLLFLYFMKKVVVVFTNTALIVFICIWVIICRRNNFIIIGGVCMMLFFAFIIFIYDNVFHISICRILWSTAMPMNSCHSKLLIYCIWVIYIYNDSLNLNNGLFYYNILYLFVFINF